jgi:hypothetical protein
MANSFALMDTDNLSMVGSYPTRAAALRVVAEAVRRYGETSPEARSLVLFRQNGPVDRAHFAKGEELVRLALAVPASTVDRPDDRSGSHIANGRDSQGTALRSAHKVLNGVGDVVVHRSDGRIREHGSVASSSSGPIGASARPTAP